MELENASWIEVENYLKKPNGILLSMGSTEQHGPIGLIGTDTICSYEIAKKVANKTKMYLAPKIAYSSPMPIFKTMKDIVYGVDKDLAQRIERPR